MTSLDLLLYAKREEEDDRARLIRYRRCWEYYNGQHDQPLPVRTGQPNDNVILNHARYVIDESAALLFGQDVIFELTEGETTPQEEWLENVWRRNRKMTFLGKLGVLGGIFGHCAIKIIPDGIEDGLPRLVLIEPEYLTVEWDDDDIETPLKYVVSWPAKGPNGREIYRRQTMELERDARGAPLRWQIENRIAYGAGRWQPDPENPDLTWNRPWPLIIDCQNIPLPGAYYGLSDLEDLSEQDAMNYAASKFQRITRYHAHPKTVGSGFMPSDMKLSEDDMTVLPSPESKIWNLEMQSDLSTMLAWIKDLRDQFYTQTRTPNLDPSKVSVGALSGFALRILYGPALAKLEMKRRTYGDMLIELNRRLLELGGHGADNYVTIHWGDPLPEDADAEMKRDQFEIDQDLVSRETVQRRRGLDPDTENERIDADKARRMTLGQELIQQFNNGQDIERNGRQAPVQNGQQPQQGSGEQPA